MVKKENTIQKYFSSYIWFPREKFDSYLFQYGFTLFISIFMVIISSVFREIQFYHLLLLLFLISIAFATFLGNKKTGIFLTIYAIIFLILFSYPLLNTTILAIIELIVFSITGFVITWIISTSKKTKLISLFNKREKEFEEEIERLIREKRQAEKEIRARDEFISIASHELKTPLTTTLLKLQTALHNVRHVSLANFSVQNLLDMLESAETQTKRLSKMINDLLNVSLMRTGRLELELDKHDLKEIMQDVVKRFIEKAENEHTKITSDAKTSIVVKVDRVRIEQVIANLISNAMKYGQGKPIHVSLQKEGSVARISVKDQGLGIPKNQQEKIFNLFERGGQNGDIKGLGIGLYISNQIVIAHGGKIRIKSKENKGSEFTVELPIK